GCLCCGTDFIGASGDLAYGCGNLVRCRSCLLCLLFYLCTVLVEALHGIVEISMQTIQVLVAIYNLTDQAGDALNHLICRDAKLVELIPGISPYDQLPGEITCCDPCQ